MKIFMIFLFFSAVFAETNTTEELKSETTGQEQQKPAIEEMEVVKEVTQAEPKEEAQPEKNSAEEKESVTQKEEPVVSEVAETDAVSTGSDFSATAGVEYVCDGGRSYTFYEPGNDPNHLCELDAGHTEPSVDWYALNSSSFCKEKIEELISQYNCAPKTQ